MTGASASSNSLENSTNTYLLSIYALPYLPHTPHCVKKWRLSERVHSHEKQYKPLAFSILFIFFLVGLGVISVESAASFCNPYVARV